MTGRRISEAWLAGAAPQAVCAMLSEAGFEAYFVGGCVRNALLGAPISDIDITTDARPDEVVALAEALQQSQRGQTATLATMTLPQWQIHYDAPAEAATD